MRKLKGVMAFLIFALSLALLIAGLASGYVSLDLLPLAPGLVYAFGGAVAISMAIVAFALGVAIRRIDALAELVRRAPGGYGPVGAGLVEHAFAAPPVEADLPMAEAGAEKARAREVPTERSGESLMEDAAPTNEIESGDAPSQEGIGDAIEASQAPSPLIGRYSSSGTNYMIFADGSIEAETQEGAFRFASMGDYKQFLADRAEGR
jgi:hypothetical protein